MADVFHTALEYLTVSRLPCRERGSWMGGVGKYHLGVAGRRPHPGILARGEGVHPSGGIALIWFGKSPLRGLAYPHKEFFYRVDLG